MTLLFKKKVKRTNFGVTLGEDVIAEIKKLAKQHHMSVSNLTEQLIVNSLKELEQQSKKENK